MPLNILYDGTGSEQTLVPEFDIVAVHGLIPHENANDAQQSWLKNNHLWLRDSLPKDIPKARIMLYKYDSAQVFSEDRRLFTAEATALLGSLRIKRKQCLNRPLLIIGHSLGGILVKQAIIHAHMEMMYEELRSSIFALVFMATPHCGSTETSKTLFGEACANIIEASSNSLANGVLKAMKANSIFSDILQDQWRCKLESYQFISCYGTLDKVVPYQYARQSLSDSREAVIKRTSDHIEICRFDLEKDDTDKEEYEEIVERMKDLCDEVSKAEKVKSLSVPSVLVDEMINTLQTFGDNPRYAMIEQKHEDTLQWIWTKETKGGPGFVEWLESEEGLFLISGKPGAGKSTLCKYIETCETTMEILRASTSGRTLLMSFFFWDLGQPSEKSFNGLLHNLLSQLLIQIPELAPAVLGRFQKLRHHTLGKSSSSIWNESELQSAFKDILQVKVPDTEILVLIDALDECENKSINQMLHFLTRLATPTSSCLRFKILCSGRPANFIELAFSQVPLLHLQDHTWQDIEDFLNTRIKAVTDHLPLDARRDRIIAEIVPEVVGKAEGVFIWATVVVEDLVALVAAGREEELYEKIKELPPELESLYARIIAKIPLRDRHHTYNYLQLQGSQEVHGNDAPDNLLAMTLASFPIDQIRAPVADSDKWTDEAKVIACHRTKSMLRDTCSGLVRLPHFNPSWPQEKQVSFFCRGQVYVHKSVKDYLFNIDSFQKVWGGIDRSLLVSSHLQRVAFFFHLIKVDSITRFQAAPSICKNKHLSVVLIHVLEQFLGAVSRSEEYGKLGLSVTWLPLLEELVRTKSSSPSETIELYDSVSIIGYLEFEKCTHDHAHEAWNTNMLCLAVSYGLFPYLKSKMRGKCCNRQGRPILHYIFRRYQEFTYELFEPIARLLHRHGFQFNQKFDGHTTWEYILIYMRVEMIAEFWNRYCFDSILILCLELGADPNQVVNLPSYQCSPLHIVLSRCYYLDGQRSKALIKAFLTRGAVTNAKDSNGITVIQFAEQNKSPYSSLLKANFPKTHRKSAIKSSPTTMSQKPKGNIVPIKDSLLARIELMERE